MAGSSRIAQKVLKGSNPKWHLMEGVPENPVVVPFPHLLHALGFPSAHPKETPRLSAVFARQILLTVITALLLLYY